MPEIEITEDQYQYLEALREDIQTDVVGKYAHVRTVDALQYLIDGYEGDVNATVPESGDGADGDKPGGFVVTDGSSTDPVTVDGEGDGSGGSADGNSGASDDGAGNQESAPDGAGGGTPMAAAGSSGGDDGMLSAMMQLLDTHDDKWAAVEGDTGYEVDLPDGSTESANTRDDVRALLFKHYE